MITYDYYRIFYFVAQYKSFTKAARALHNNQPNITRCMNNLEQELKCTLFLRSNKGIALTPEGRQLYEHVALAFEQLSIGEEEIRQNGELEHGLVSIGASETALSIYLLERLKIFHMTYPGIRLKIYNHSTPQAVDAVKNGEIDFAVVTTPTTAKPPLKEVKLQSFREVLIGGKTFTALSSQTLSLRELQNYPLICLGKETMTFAFYHHLFLSYGLELKPDTEAATTDQILPLVKSELGLAFIPEFMAIPAIQSHEVISIPLQETIPCRHICMVSDFQRPLSSAAKKLKDLILQS